MFRRILGCTRMVERLGRSSGLPAVVVVGGAPATGKTTLALPLARALELPLLSKDLMKESLMDSFGVGDLSASQRIGGASWELLFLVAGWLSDARTGFILEGNFERTATERLRAIAVRSRMVQITCRCSDAVRQDRYEQRSHAPNRHPGHMDGPRIARGQRPSTDFGPFELGVPTLVVDTTDDPAPAFPDVLAFVRAGL